MKCILGGNNIYIKQQTGKIASAWHVLMEKSLEKNLNIADVRNWKLEHHFKPSSAVN